MKTVTIGDKTLTFNLTIGNIDSIKAKTGFDILALDPPPLWLLECDDRLVLDVAQSMTSFPLEEIAAQLDGDTYGRVKQALIDEVTDFFRKLGPGKLPLMQQLAGVYNEKALSLFKEASLGTAQFGAQQESSGSTPGHSP